MFTLLHFLYFHHKLLCPSDGMLIVPRVKVNNPLGTQKISIKSRLVRAAEELQNFKTDHISRIVPAVTWLKYCRYGVKLYSIN